MLAGLVRCAAWGRSMHGAILKSKPYCRCNTQRPDCADTSAHPRTTAVREERILDAVDKWLNQLADAKHRNATVASVLAADGAGPKEPPEVRNARRALTNLPVELDRVLAAIRAGMDANLGCDDEADSARPRSSTEHHRDLGARAHSGAFPDGR